MFVFFSVLRSVSAKPKRA